MVDLTNTRRTSTAAATQVHPAIAAAVRTGVWWRQDCRTCRSVLLQGLPVKTDGSGHFWLK